MLRSGGLHAENAALLLSGQRGGEIPIAALALPLPAIAATGGERIRVPVVVEADGPSLLAAMPRDARRLRFEVCLYALDPSGNVAASLANTVEIDLAQLGPMLGRGGVRFAGELRLPPGEHSLRVLVRNLDTKLFGLQLLPLLVRGPGEPGPIVLAPLFGLTGPAAGAASWLELNEAGGGTAGPQFAPLSAAAPTALPILVADGEATFELPAFALPQKDLTLAIEVRGGSGAAVVAELPARVVSRRTVAGGSGFEVLSAAFTPHGLAPGFYELWAVASGPEVDAGRRAVSPGEAFRLLPRGGSASSATWADAGRSGRHDVASPLPRGRSSRREAALESGYRAALARLAAGDEGGALAAAAELEVSSLREPRASLDDLASAEARAVRSLAETDAEALVPIGHLYELLYREARAHDHPQLAGHAREMIFAVTRLYAARSHSPAAKTLASRLLVSFAGVVTEVSGAASAYGERVLQRAAELDRDNVAALLALAVCAQTRGDADRALSLLERVLTLRPDDREARLRSALLLARLGRKRQARGRLETVVSDAARADWTVAVAFQELARLLIESGDLAAAERLLQEGRRRFPDDEKLALELTLVMSLRRRGSDAREIVAAVRPASAGAAGEEARHRYTELPLERFAQAVAEAQPAVRERLPALAAALRDGRSSG